MPSGKASTHHRTPAAIARLVLAVLPVVVVVGWLVGATPAHAATPTIDVSDAVPNPVTEGNAPTTTNVTFTVTLAESPGPAVKVSFATMLGSATANADYVFQDSSVTFPAGATGVDLIKTITVVVNGDNAPEPNETFFVQLYSPTGGGVLGDRWGQATINNDDGAPPTISVSDATPSPVVEGNSGTTPASFNVVLSASPSAPVTYKWASNPATASAGTDYVVATGTGTFAAGTGTLTQTVTVQVKGDTTPEGNETFLLQIYDVGGASVTDAYGGATIQNDDAAVPIISIADVTKAEGNTAQVPVTLSFSPPGPVTVKFRTMQDTYFNTTATAGSDYNTQVSTLSWTAADPMLTKTIDIPILTDALNEAPERFYVQIYDPVGGNLAAIRYGMVSINTAPVATADSFDAIGNTGLFVGTTRPATQAGKEIAGSVLTNDTDPDVPPGGLVVVAETKPTTLGGSVVIEADGNFTYHPDDADVGVSDSFSYTVSDGAATTTGTVTLPITGQVWYVRNNEPAGGDGTSDTPFDTLAEAEAASGTGDTVFVFDGNNTTTNLATGYAMNSGERLIGESRPLSLDLDLDGPLPPSALHPGTAGAQPTLTASNEDVIVLASNVLVDGVDVDPSGTGGGVSGGAGTETVTVQNVNVTDTGTAGTQPGIEMDGTTGVNRFTGVTVTNGGSATAIGVRINNADRVLFANTATNTIATSGAKALDAASTSLLTSRWNDITVTGSGSGAIRLSSTTGQPVLGDGAGTDLSLQTTSGATAALDIASSNTVTVNAAGTDTISATGGPALDIRNSNGSTFDFDSVSSTNSSADDGINLDTNLSTTFTAGAGAISGAAGIAVDVNGGAGAVTYAGSINDGSGQSAEVTGRTGGAVSLSGNIADSADGGGGISLAANSGGSTTFSGASKVVNTGASNAVTMTSSGGHSLSFAGGGLDIDASSGKGLEATGGGTIDVQGSGNSIATTTGTALNVSGTTIAGVGLTFVSVNSNGASNGIVLDNAGSGGLTVTGTGSAGTGGTLQNMTGADGATSGIGVRLNSVSNVSLSWMNLHDFSNFAIRGNAVSNFTLSRATINGVNGSNATFDEGTIAFNELTGSANINNSTIQGGIENNLKVTNTGGSLNRLTLDVVTLGAISNAAGDDNVLVQNIASGTVNVTVQNSFLTNAAGDHFQLAAAGTVGSDLIFTGNTVSNNHANVLGGGGVITVTVAGSASMTYNISSNSVRDSKGSAIFVGKLFGTAPGNGTMSGTIESNTIGVTGVANSGSSEGSGIEVRELAGGSHTTLIKNNQIRRYSNHGIFVQAGGAAQSVTGVTHNGTFNVTIQGNTIAEPNAPGGGLAQNGIHLNSGTNSTGGADAYQVCMAIGDPTDATKKNTLTGSGALGGTDYRLRQRFATTVRLPGYTGAATGPPDADLTAYLTPRTSGGFTFASGADGAPGGFFNTSPAGSACPLPA